MALSFKSTQTESKEGRCHALDTRISLFFLEAIFAYGLATFFSTSFLGNVSFAHFSYYFAFKMHSFYSLTYSPSQMQSDGPPLFWSVALKMYSYCECTSAPGMRITSKLDNRTWRLLFFFIFFFGRVRRCAVWVCIPHHGRFSLRVVLCCWLLFRCKPTTHGQPTQHTTKSENSRKRQNTHTSSH